MKAIVTGGAGFLGSHLCDLLLKEGHEVICIDNLITGNTKNISHIKSDKFTYLKYDVTKPLYFGDKIDYIFHLASPASPIDYLELPIQTLKVGALGTYNMLGLAKEQGARLLLASTSEVYGDPLVNPQTETYWGNVNPIGPRGVYDEAKRYAEAITMAYHTHHGVDTRIVRIFNTYGPRMRAGDGRVVPNFINQALKNEDITVYGNGSQTRSFCYVSDLVRGIYKLMMSDFYEPVNIGNPSEMSILEFAETVIKITNSDSKITYKDLPVDDPKVRRPDISRAKEVLGWEPEVDLREGLEKTVQYFKSEIC
ncbi:nucleoside-diphosphate-sugar epimerase [Methanolobus tindarius DSM 2278]|uniref:UDP-glucuronate decarboxylase n=1 Tax=Methanolobus tindarius DSM 2278 TaxID=1090322 RepID=W9DUS7_METTI|nr:UDP-glucuronic acid decarboxylase family protein [Methanolobus tindarius]ETA67442.1 nucleoside-diphosphate-sugar epimerase [Methanolobus tindarius DSM 2278]